MEFRFAPDSCPACGNRLAPKYSEFRGGRRHWAYRPFLMFGFLVALVLLAGVVWETGAIVADWPGPPVTPRTKAMRYLILLAPGLIFVGAFAVSVWWVGTRLPLTFRTTCEGCNWSGECRVFGHGR